MADSNNWHGQPVEISDGLLPACLFFFSTTTSGLWLGLGLGFGINLLGISCFAWHSNSKNCVILMFEFAESFCASCL